MSVSINVLVVDAAFTHVGAAVIGLGADPEDDRLLEWACVKTEKSAAKKGVRVANDDAERCAEVFREMRDLVRRWKVAAMVAELPGGSQSARAARCLGAATAIMACVAEAFGLPAVWTDESSGKLAFVKSRAATKEQMIAAAKAVWRSRKVEQRLEGPACKLEHVADALAAFEVAKNDNVVKVLRQRLSTPMDWGIGA